MDKEKLNRGSDNALPLGVAQSSGGSKHLKRLLGWGALAVVIAMVVISWDARNKNDAVQFKTQEVGRGSIIVTVTATGTLEPTNQVDVGSELSGIIRTVEVDYNDTVKVGQVLAKLDTSKLEAQVLQSKAALESARARVLEAEATVKEMRAELARFERVRELSGNKVPSDHELDAAEAALQRALADEASAKASVSEAQATLNAIETDLGKTVIYSPINGMVLVRAVEPGQTVAASLQAPVLFTLAEDLTQMELHMDVDEADVGQVKEGQEATFTVDAFPDRTFPARITQVRYGSQTVDGVVTYETLLNADNSDLSLRPGMTATAEITVKKVEDAILVPNAALRFTPPVKDQQEPSGGRSMIRRLIPRPPRAPSRRRDGATADNKQPRVWTVRDGQLAAIPVSTGSTDGIMTEVTAGGVEPGMALVVDIVSAAR